VENLERYEPGGYHPIAIGDVLANRYRIVHKLGFGTYSTVWLAQDQQQTAYVAVKVSTADTPHHEVEILNALAHFQPDHPGRTAIPVIHDQFRLQGPNGDHRCSVMSPTRSSLAAAKSCCCFPMESARVAAG
jgi:serine/threonine protein kinase